MVQQRSTRELTQSGERQPRQIYLFATYTLEPGKGTSKDRAEQLLAWGVNWYETLQGLRESKEQAHYQQLLPRSFTNG